MALVLVATAASASANSYATVADFRAYMETRPEGWADTDAANEAEDPEVARALVTATALLEQYVDWDGWTFSSAQRLSFPRAGLLTPTGFALPSDVVPERLRDATCELAVQVMAGNRTLDSEVSLAGIKALKAGPVELEFKESIAIRPIPDRVWQMVSLWGNLLQGQRTIPLVRV